MRIALTGNPNSGKTTMYNALTGRNERVGNWAGVTVENFKTLVSTVSMCSKPGYGQICGQAPVLRQNRGYAYFAMKCSTFLTWDMRISHSVA